MTPVQPPLDEALVSPAFGTDPYPVYRRLLEEAPVYWSEAWGIWLISRYDDVLAGLRDDGSRFSMVGTIEAKLAVLDTEDRAAFEPLRDHYSMGLLHSDPPAHTRVRSLISRVFTPRVIENMRPVIEDVVHRLLDEAEARKDNDLVRDLAFPLPALVLCSVLGMPPEDHERFKGWSDEMAVFIGSGTAVADDAHRAQENLLKAREYLSDLAEERRRDPQDDVISRLVAAAQEDQDALSMGELLNTCVTFMIGGHETTTALISSAVLLLSRHPGQRDAYANDVSLVKGLIEETLRYEPSGQRVARVIASDFELDGHSLRAGQSAFLMLGAAGRDAARFPDPDRFDIARAPNRHLTFGMGHHACIGAPLARLEVEIALSTMYDRYPGLDAGTDEPDWIGNFGFRQLRSLPVAMNGVGQPRMR